VTTEDGEALTARPYSGAGAWGVAATPDQVEGLRREVESLRTERDELRDLRREVQRERDEAWRANEAMTAEHSAAMLQTEGVLAAAMEQVTRARASSTSSAISTVELRCE
jgi:FtsZ-binding cell division protein ZapB